MDFHLGLRLGRLLRVHSLCPHARHSRSSTRYSFLAHPALDPRGFAFAVQPDWADLVAGRDLVASRTPAMGADHLGALASLGMEICVPTVRTVPNLIFQCVKRDGRRDGRATTVPTVPVYVIDVLSRGTVGTIGTVRSPLFSGNGDCARPLAARRAIKRDF